MLKTYLEDSEIDQVIEAASTLRDKLIIRLLYYVGCRVSELNSIEVEGIDYQRGMILIPHLKSAPTKKECPGCHRKIGTKQMFCPKCGADAGGASVHNEGNKHRQRLVRVDRDTLEMVREYLSRRKRVSDRLIPLSRQMIYNIVREVAGDAGFIGEILLNPETGRRHCVSPHRMRDSHALRWLRLIRERGDDPGHLKELQIQLGHKNFETTTRYWKLSPGAGGLYDELWGSSEQREVADSE